MQNLPEPAAGVAFRSLRAFNAPGMARLSGSRSRIDARAARLFEGDALHYRLVRALGRRRALPIKEVVEAFEFHERVRRRVRAPELVDMCCGHGLAGMLFALLDREVERVTLLDKRRPASFAAVYDAVVEVGPWVADTVRYVEAPLSRASGKLGPGCTVVAIHACGGRTDRCLEAAVAVGGRAAVMPCCYFGTSDRAPRALRAALGAELASDIDRTYRLESQGYRVAWSAIPRSVTPMCRILIAEPG